MSVIAKWLLSQGMYLCGTDFNMDSFSMYSVFCSTVCSHFSLTFVASSFLGYLPSSWWTNRFVTRLALVETFFFSPTPAMSVCSRTAFVNGCQGDADMNSSPWHLIGLVEGGSEKGGKCIFGGLHIGHMFIVTTLFVTYTCAHSHTHSETLTRTHTYIHIAGRPLEMQNGTHPFFCWSALSGGAPTGPVNSCKWPLVPYLVNS